MSALSIPHARPPGTPTRNSGPSAPKDPRGVVRRYGGPPSALVERASAKATTSAHRRLAMVFDTRDTLAVQGHRVCPPFLRRRPTFVREPSHIRAHAVSVQLYEPCPELLCPQTRSRSPPPASGRRRESNEVM